MAMPPALGFLGGAPSAPPLLPLLPPPLKMLLHLLSLLAVLVLPLKVAQSLAAGFGARYDDPTIGGVQDERTGVLGLQDDTVYIGSLPFLLDPYRFLRKCQRALKETAWFRFQFCGVSPPSPAGACVWCVCVR